MSFESEQAVLGSMTLDPDCICLVADKLTPEMFADAKNRKIYLDILDLNNSGIPIDALMLRDKGTDANYVVEIMEAVPHAASAEYYADIVIDSYRADRLSGLAKKIEKTCAKPGAFRDKLESITKELDSLKAKSELDRKL